MAMMTSKLRFRLGGFVFAIGLLASLIFWAALTSSRRLEESRAKARVGTSESFRIAHHFQQALMDLNDRLLKLATTRDTNEWMRFENEWKALNSWIDEQHLSSPRERELLQQIDTTYDDYYAAAQQIETK